MSPEVIRGTFHLSSEGVMHHAMRPRTLASSFHDRRLLYFDHAGAGQLYELRHQLIGFLAGFYELNLHGKTIG